MTVYTHIGWDVQNVSDSNSDILFMKHSKWISLSWNRNVSVVFTIRCRGKQFLSNSGLNLNHILYHLISWFSVSFLTGNFYLNKFFLKITTVLSEICDLLTVFTTKWASTKNVALVWTNEYLYSTNNLCYSIPSSRHTLVVLTRKHPNYNG